MNWPTRPVRRAGSAIRESDGMDEKKRSEILAFFWFVSSVLVLLSLLSYSPNDIAFEVSSPNVPVHNFVGVAGAYTAWVLVLFFGKTSYFLVPLFLLWALAKWVGKKGQKLWLKMFSTVIFFTSACALFSLLAHSTDVRRFDAGGIIGFFTAIFLSNLFGSAGTFVALSLFLLSIILATELLVLQITTELFKKFKRKIEPAIVKKEDNKTPAASIAKRNAEEPLEQIKPLIKIPEMRPKETVVANFTKPEIKVSASKPVKPVLSETAKPVLNHEEPEEIQGDYRLPGADLFESPPRIDSSKIQGDLETSSKVLEDTLKDFGIEAKVVEVESGPTITRYELQPAAGVKVQRITSLENDIALKMQATSVRIIAPIPGKSRVGIEVPNSATSTVYIKDILLSDEFRKESSKISMVLGKDTAGAPLVANLADMPHLLIAGATNTGKSVCINSILTSILCRATPDEVKFILIDPKMVELHFYNDLPHLVCPVVTDKVKTPGVLAWLVSEMERRYRVLSKVGAKNILSFNEKVEKREIHPEILKQTEENADEAVIVKKMPYIVIVIDELADLILASQQEVETAITRLAQLARAVGIHMILATQRPSVDVITGVIKANFPARIAFQVASKVDSRTILDENGADKLLGRGDFLFMDPRKSKLLRAQGAWVQDKEIERVTEFIKSQRKPLYQEAVTQTTERKAAFADFKRDEVYEEAKRIVLEIGQASVSMVQRRLGLGYTRAARLIDMMEEDGIVGPYRGAKPREILVSKAGDQNKEEKEEA